MTRVDSPSQSSARVRVLQEHDLAEVMRIENAVYEFPWTEAIFRDCFKSGYTGIAIERDATLLGYGMLSAAAGEAHILNVTM